MLRIEVVWCPAPGAIDLTPLSLPEGSTVADALRASGVLERHGLSLETVDAGIWFRACALDQALREGDQVQLYRPLTVDPKEARRQRYRGKRAATTGNPPR
jgi:uncharacterized protein